ncbi:Nup93/Nic96-domain-containing protein [Chlamydoabsidia padenii]|nr:Nup93/Nic96-domain-containing protein [Chlamydoabsidia padenii]
MKVTLKRCRRPFGKALRKIQNLLTPFATKNIKSTSSRQHTFAESTKNINEHSSESSFSEPVGWTVSNVPSTNNLTTSIADAGWIVTPSENPINEGSSLSLAGHSATRSPPAAPLSLTGPLLNDTHFSVENLQKKESNLASCPSSGGIPVLNLAHCVSVVMDMNLYRLHDQDYCVASAFSKAMSFGNQHHQETVFAWDFLRHLVGENRLEGRFVSTYVVTPTDSRVGVKSKRDMIDKVTDWLECCWMHRMEEMLKNAGQENTTFENTLYQIYLFTRITLMDKGKWKDKRIEIVKGAPVWAVAYYALRGGKADLVLNHMKTHPKKYDSCPHLITCLEDYLSNPDHCLTRLNQRLIEREEQACADNTGDPYKWMIMQLLSRRLTPITFGMLMVREGVHHPWQPNYKLHDLQTIVRSDSGSGENPFDHFIILLTTLQFERAIDYLYNNDETRSYAFHFAIALMYYGLIRIPTGVSDNLLTEQEDGTATWDIKTMIDQYLQHKVYRHRTYQSLHPYASIHYLAVLSLYSTRNGYINDNMTTLVKTSVEDLISNMDDSMAFFKDLPKYAHGKSLWSTLLNLVKFMHSKNWETNLVMVA